MAAAQQERFSRIRHDAGFPSDALAYCLSEAGITLDQVESVVFYPIFREIRQNILKLSLFRKNILINQWLSFLNPFCSAIKIQDYIDFLLNLWQAPAMFIRCTTIKNRKHGEAYFSYRWLSPIVWRTR